MDAADPPPSAGIGGKLRQRLVSIINSLHAAFPDGLIVERPDADVLELYTETHFVLACVLLHLTGDGSADRLAMAETRLRRWSGLRTEDPFNNFGNCLSLALLRARGLADLPLGRLLETICLGQTPAPLCREVGNNILVMKLLTELVVRPLALGGQPAPAAWPEIEAMLDRYRSSEGFYFDEPRHGAGERYFPGTYCLMFLFLIGLVYSLTRRAGFLARFIDGLRAVLPFFTEDGGFSYLGRSDNTTFANGLAIFCLRLGATADFAGAEICGKLLRAAEAYFLTIPQTQGGWPKVNRFANGTDPTGDVRSRDEYTHPANYAAAAVAYILAGEFSWRVATGGFGRSGPPRRSDIAGSRYRAPRRRRGRSADPHPRPDRPGAAAVSWADNPAGRRRGPIVDRGDPDPRRRRCLGPARRVEIPRPARRQAGPDRGPRPRGYGSVGDRVSALPGPRRRIVCSRRGIHSGAWRRIGWWRLMRCSGSAIATGALSPRKSSSCCAKTCAWRRPIRFARGWPPRPGCG